MDALAVFTVPVEIHWRLYSYRFYSWFWGLGMACIFYRRTVFYFSKLEILELFFVSGRRLRSTTLFILYRFYGV